MDEKHFSLKKTVKAVAAGIGSSLRCMKAARPGAPLECPCCHSPMKVIVVITEPEEVLKILRHPAASGENRPIASGLRSSCA